MSVVPQSGYSHDMRPVTRSLRHCAYYLEKGPNHDVPPISITTTGIPSQGDHLRADEGSAQD